ncbi:hypothetical protein IQ283_13455 [Alkalihalobacillus hwajinpoensis]|uniref:hypothetical protein n=1 Tax=Guptibacillus hwajinpoensis TaxID=208199 RepID=UPI001883820E|nr:hypothetical protein [Pseudalkalibacillus hwajinpoensis]MBF0707598.1 hypothetical protein [Pseudalkalibacillus hwajinpoensis]
MKSKTAFLESIQRKIVAGSFTIVLLSCMNLIISSVFIDYSLRGGLAEFQYDASYIYIILFYGVIFYGVPVSLLSDSLARSISTTIDRKEGYISTILHILAGSLVGFVSLIPAVTFLVIDRILVRKPIIHFRFGALMFTSLCVMTYFIDLSIFDVLGIS